MGGLIYLLLPLLPIVYVLVAILISVLVTRWMLRRNIIERRWKFWIVGCLIFMALLLVPTWHLIVAHIYIKQKCGSEGGLEVYQEVVVPDKYFDVIGVPRPKYVPASDGKDGLYCFGSRCFKRLETRTIVLNLPMGTHVSKLVISYQDSETKQVFGRYVSFALSTSTSWEGSAVVCPKFTQSESLTTNIFVRSKAAQSVNGGL